MSSVWLVLKLLFALLVGGAVGGILLAAATMLATYAEAPRVRLMTENFWLYGPILAPTLVVTAFAVGIPSFFILRYCRYLNWISVLSIGACVGLLGATFLFGSGRGFGAPFTIDRALTCIVIGMVSASSAFVVLLRSNISLNGDAPQAARPLA
jgi:hypothetical protein